MQTAKLFMNGRSQAVRLPAEFRFEGQEVYIRRDPLSGDVILSARRAWRSWDEFLAGQDPSAVPENFLQSREQPVPQQRCELTSNDVGSDHHHGGRHTADGGSQ
ncbi:MAG: type II toxin-antitoxin system VapB family antitoxin [Lautropia sp.]|nr:type II toxin-antitoxin system VapB family antitoxin [Lautropia sp.]